MDSSKKLFVLSLVGIIIVIFVGDSFGETYSGKVLSIESTGERKIILVEGISFPGIIFDEELIDIIVGDYIYFKGRESTYLGESQIIILKVWK